MAATKFRIRLAVGGVIAVTAVAAGAWISTRPGAANDDCQTLNDILDYSRAADVRLLVMGTHLGEDPQGVVSGYTTWAQRMHTYAGQVRDPKLRDQAFALASADSDLVDAWARAARARLSAAAADTTSGNPTEVLSQTSLRFARTQRGVAAEAGAECP